MAYIEHGKRIRSENLAGRIATKVAQGEGGLGLRTDMVYTVKHIQKGLYNAGPANPLTHYDKLWREIYGTTANCPDNGEPL